LLGNPSSFVSRVTLDRARAIPREMSSTAPLAIVRGTARELFLRHPRGGRLYVVASRLHLTTTTRAATDGPSQDKPWPESAHEYDPSVVINKTGTSVPSFSSSRDIASRTPRTAHTSRAAAPPRPRPPQLTPSHFFFTLHHHAGFLVTVQASRKAKRVRNAVEEAKYMLGTCADPPSLGDSLPLHKAGELGCAFLPLLGYRPHAVVPYARECIETFVSDPPPPSDTPEYLARLVPVERTCDASVATIEETLRQLQTTQYPELTPTLEPKT
jgi:hypothetical protein